MRVSVGKLDVLNSAAVLFHWKGARRIIHQLSGQLSMGQVTANQAVKRLDELYSNQKYSELDLGEALQTLSIRANETAMPDAPVKLSLIHIFPSRTARLTTQAVGRPPIAAMSLRLTASARAPSACAVPHRRSK